MKLKINIILERVTTGALLNFHFYYSSLLYLKLLRFYFARVPLIQSCFWHNAFVQAVNMSPAGRQKKPPKWDKPGVQNNNVDTTIFFITTTSTTGSRDSSVSIQMGYALNGRGSFPGRSKRLFLLHSVQTGSEAHPAH
jgi:hypothetical protein